MEVIHALQANLTAPGNGPVLHMMQHDGSRQIAVQLYAGTAVWAVPEGATAGIGYTLPDRQSSYYEILSDGTAACTIAGNTVTAVLAPVLTSIAGETKVSIILTKDGIQLSTFPFRIRVDARPGEVNPGAQPDAASPFIGKLYYGGDMGAPIPLGLGNGVRVVKTEDGSLLLIVAGSGNGSIAEETDPTVPEWAKQLQKPSYTAEEVGADAAGTASCLLGEHNGSPNSHWDVRMELQALSERLTAVLDSDDTTLDQLSEIVAYIKSNKTLIDAITTSKVSVADIVDNLVTNVSGKPLSAAMGVALASDIDSVRSSIEMKITGHNSNRNSHEDIRQHVQRNGDQIAALGRDKLDADALPEALTEHNDNVGAHGALVLKVNRLMEDFRALADCDDQTLDQLSEIVAYIKSNKTLIDAITTSKVNVTDIVNDLTTNLSNRPLSAAMGMELRDVQRELESKKLDAATLPTAINTALTEAKKSGAFDGAPGYTPVNGKDYYTEADKTEMVAAVVAALPKYAGEVSAT